MGEMGPEPGFWPGAAEKPIDEDIELRQEDVQFGRGDLGGEKMNGRGVSRDDAELEIEFSGQLGDG